MPRRPDPGTKDQQAYVRAKTEEERKKIQAVKEICARNNLEVRKVLMDGIDKFLKDHHWPPGNSQTVLEAYEVQPIITIRPCGIKGCHKTADFKLFHEQTTVYRCSGHKHSQLPWKAYGSAPIKRI